MSKWKEMPIVAGNAFCPTGAGGGVDPSCSPGGGSGGGDDDNERMTPHDPDYDPFKDDQRTADAIRERLYGSEEKYSHIAHLLNGAKVVGAVGTKKEATEQAKALRSKGKYGSIVKDPKGGKGAKFLVTIPESETI